MTPFLGALIHLIVFFCVIGISFFAEQLGLLWSYRAKVHGTKDPNEFPDIKIPLSVHELISRFDQKVKIRIKDASLDCNVLASFEKHPPYIILSKQLFDRRSNEAEQFNDNDIMVSIAHELGHLIQKRHFLWLIQLVTSAMIMVILTCIIILLGERSVYQFIPGILIILFLINIIGYLSREDEERADSFAIVEARIPLETFARSLTKIWKSIKQQKPPETRWSYLYRIIGKFIINTVVDP